MSVAVNPYQSPETAAIPVKPLTAQGVLTENMLIYLKGASPWLRFVGVLGFISAGLMVLSFAFLLFSPLVTDLTGQTIFVGEVFGGGIVVIFFIGLGALMFFPSLFVYRFGEKIRNYLRTGTDQELEQAFKNNRYLWKFIGIICIVNLAFLPLMVAGNIIIMLVSGIN